MNEPIKPRQVVIAGQIMWSLWALGGALILIGIIVGLVQSQPGVIVRTIQFLIVVSLLGWLIRSVLMGRNWARIVYALLACIVVAVVLLRVVSSPRLDVVSIAAPLALIGVYGTVLWLLFHPASAPWFRRNNNSST
jgi:hypothetical protein